MANKDWSIATARNMSDESVKGLPPTCVMTSEFDHQHRGARWFADRLKALAPEKYLGFLDIPGTTHCMEFHYPQPEVKWYFEDFKKGFDAWVAK